jgi:drug/metabolite transporter (DMT)-like permease
MVGVGALIVWALVVVIRSWWSPDVSPYDRRYIRLWAILGACGVPIGFGLVLVSDHENQGSLAMFGNSPIDPGLAIALAIGTAVLFAASAIIYHRTVDDHEERAYLWGSTIAYYFILTAFPVAWLLARGGLIEKLGIGSAIAILMMSLVVQTAVWLRFKFR